MFGSYSYPLETDSRKPDYAQLILNEERTIKRCTEILDQFKELEDLHCSMDCTTAVIGSLHIQIVERQSKIDHWIKEQEIK
jgi:hypothetical protein